MRGGARVGFCLSLAALAVLAGVPASLRNATAATDSAEAYVAAATATAGEDMKGVLSLCAPVGAAAEPARNPISTDPAKVFDNLYYVGPASRAAWALTTSAGIIIIDSLDNAQDAQAHIEGGLRK